MIEFPRMLDTYFTERAGVVAVEALVNSMRCIWRETPNADVGIDGQIEYVAPDGACTGQVVAAQIKSGQAYLQNEQDDSYLFYPSTKHRNYWHNYPIPVIVILYDPSNNVGYWTDARRSLRSPNTSDDAAIKVSRDSQLNELNKAKLFLSTGPIGGRVLSTDEVVFELARNICNEASFHLTFLDLFGFGLIDVGRQLFFSMSLCMDLAQIRAEVHGYEACPGSSAYDFIEQYMRFLVAQNLIHYDFSDFLIQWEENEMTPVFIAPFTARGRDVLRRLHELEAGEGLFYEASLELALQTKISLITRMPVMTVTRQRILAEMTPISP